MITNYLQPTSFHVSISRLPNVEFFLQRAMIPAVSANPIQQPAPIQNYYETFDRLTYAEFDLGFIVDENMENYIEVLDWMEKLGAPESTDQFKVIEASDDGLKSDITFVINNSHKNSNMRIVFKDCFPIALSSIALSVVAGDIQYPEVNATFRYDTFTIEKI